MVWIILGVIACMIFFFLKDRSEMLSKQVDSRGGMLKKYEYLVSRMTNDPSAKIAKVTRDQIYIKAKGEYTSVEFLITELFDSVQIDWVSNLAFQGIHKKRWKFPHNSPQELMYKEIDDYIAKKWKEIFGNSFG